MSIYNRVMVYRGVGHSALFCLFALGVGYAQVYPPGGYPPGGGYPGGYPPGGYPPGGYPGGYPYPGGGGGIPVPSRGGSKPSKKTTAGQPMPNFRGKLKVMDKKTISLELGDNRVLDFKRNDKTKFLKNGDEVKDPKFTVGDQLSIEGTEDAEGYMTAVNVYWEKGASAGAATADAKDSKNEGVTDTWKDAPAKDGTAPKEGAAAPRPATTAAPSAPAAPQASAEKAPPPSQAADDPGPPRLRRGGVADQTREHASDAPVQSAAAEPPPAAPARAGSRPAVVEDDAPPPPPRRNPDEGYIPIVQKPDDPVIRKAADAAMDFTEALPNYVCQEMMSRYQSETRPANFHPLDVVTANVIYENGKEDYRNVTVNGRAKKSIEETGGAWSTGEFGTVLIDLFSPATNATFHYRKDSRIAAITSKEYDFEVKRENSHWAIHMASQTFMPPYKGTVWIDPQTSRVMRIEMEAFGFPDDFPTDHVESATDYQYVRMGDAKQYLLPVHAETLSCQRGTNYCSKNTIDFRNYHKYTGESSITFGK